MLKMISKRIAGSVERLTKSVFRVVTKDRKLTNCFSNSYRREREDEDDSKVNPVPRRYRK